NLNIGLEGSSITRPLFFDGNNYSFWKTRMTIFLQSLDYQLWHIIVNGPRMPTRTIEGVVSPKPENEYNDNDFRMLQLNSKAKHVLFCAVGPNEFNRISSWKKAFKKNFPQDEESSKREEPTCYECKKPGHLKNECPNLKKKEQFKKKNEYFKKKKAMVATSDSDSSSSEEESDEEVTHIAFMEIEDEEENEVNFTFDELQNAYEKLYVEYENV
ncbi:LOW QUALITY PROTEIN: zf-CCHC domain-containing protein/DUF4219 domain-containing protein, partial [Cephalotus follicularis]